MPNLGDVRIVISPPVHARLLEIQRKLREEKRRQVTLTETLEVLLERAAGGEDHA